jgi:ABC-type branched-subunit amino acid transport system substrate-binding protein
MGGARIELLLADSETKVEVARTEADRLIGAGAQLLTGGFHSAHVAAISALAQQRRVPYLTNDLFGKTATAGFEAAHKGANPGFEIVEVIPFPETAADLSTEVSRARAARPDAAALAASAALLAAHSTIV